MREGSRGAVFLDRDGVLNEAILIDGKPHAPIGLQDLRIRGDAPEALQRLKGVGLALVCVTNQPDVARGIQPRAAVEAINVVLCAALPLDGMFVCYHDDRDECLCRKPRPGLLIQAAAVHGIDLHRSFMIGDRWRDIEAGRRAGCRTILMASRHAREDQDTTPDYRADSLADAAAWILRHRAPGGGLP